MLQRVTTVYVSVDLLSDHNAARRPSRDAAQVGDDTHSTVVQPVPVVAVAAVSRCGAAGDGYSEAGGSTGVRDAHGGSTPAAARCVQHRLPLRVSVDSSNSATPCSISSDPAVHRSHLPVSHHGRCSHHTGAGIDQGAIKDVALFWVIGGVAYWYVHFPTKSLHQVLKYRGTVPRFRGRRSRVGLGLGLGAGLGAGLGYSFAVQADPATRPRVRGGRCICIQDEDAGDR
jgi:hypothetical protein